MQKEARFFDSRAFEIGPLETLSKQYRSLCQPISNLALAARAAHAVRKVAKLRAIYQAQLAATKDPEYERLRKRYSEFQKIYTKSNGKPGPEILAELRKTGAKLSDVRFESSMGAFVEHGRKKPAPDPILDAAIAADPKISPRPWIVLGF